MRRKYIMAGAMLYLSLLAGTASANSSALVEETENSTEVWQVPHKPKGTKTRLKIQPKAEFTLCGDKDQCSVLGRCHCKHCGRGKAAQACVVRVAAGFQPLGH